MKIAQNFSTAYGGLAEHSKPALSAFSKSSLGQLFRLHCFRRGLCYTLLRGLRQSTSGIFGFYVGTTGRLCKALSQATPRIFGFHVGTREGFIIYRLTCSSPLFAPPLEPPFCKTFREIRAISAHIPLERHFPGQTKIPEKPGVKPLFGDFTLELLIRFERTTCSLRVSCSTG